MTNSSGIFKTAQELTELGFYRVSCSLWRRGSEEYVPLLEGKMIQIYNSRYASVGVNPNSLSGQGVTIRTSLSELQNPDFLPTPRYWVPYDSYEWNSSIDWAVGFNDVANVNNERTVICSLISRNACGNTLPLYLLDAGPRMPCN